MKEIKLSQNKVALVDDEDFEYLNQFKWYALKKPNTYYAVRHIRLANGKQTLIQMHRVILNVPKGMETDHKNQNGLDNRRINIRICTKSENGMNRNSYKNSSSRFKGVSWCKRDKIWRAQLEYKRKVKNLGCFLSEREAALTYDKKAIEVFGEFAKLNNEV
uniref:Putative homing endonuclease n=1 Tax=viral metagenome TaxID=1070528 RepID=A0A6H1ZRX6_9ZZZZ